MYIVHVYIFSGPCNEIRTVIDVSLIEISDFFHRDRARIYKSPYLTSRHASLGENMPSIEFGQRSSGGVATTEAQMFSEFEFLGIVIYVLSIVIYFRIKYCYYILMNCAKHLGMQYYYFTQCLHIDNGNSPVYFVLSSHDLSIRYMHSVK